MKTRKILAFKGLRYNQEKINDMKNVVTPPYDVISDDMQNEFYNRSEFNFCRVDLTKEKDESRYPISEKTFSKWLADKVILQDEKPAIYIHHQIFKLPNQKEITRVGFFAARKIEDFSEGGIKPHEKTLEGPKTDRLNLTRAVKANLSPVFSLYPDAKNEVSALFDSVVCQKPLYEFTTHEGETHKLWKMEDENLIHKIDDLLFDLPLFIADGHHRYETALNYRNEILKSQDVQPQNASQQLLMYFSNMDDEGLVILPIHRALHSLSNFEWDAFLQKLESVFEIESFTKNETQAYLKKQEELTESHHAFLLLPKNHEQGFLLKLDRTKWLASDVAQKLPQSLASLDVSVLHKLIFENFLQISQEAQDKQENIIYWKSTEKALKEIDSGKCELTFLLNSTRMKDMKQVALEGQKMPQKSTYFYPKIISGLVAHSVDTKDQDGTIA